MRNRTYVLIGLSLLAVSSFAFASPAKAKPIPAGPAAYTWSDDNKIAARHFSRVIAGSYKSMGRRDPKWDAEATSFLEAFVPWYTASRAGDFNEALERGKTAVGHGCDDPIVLTCLGYMLGYSGKHAEAIPLLQSALEQFEKNPKLPRDVGRIVPIWLIRAHTKTADLMPTDDKSWRRLACKWAAEAQGEGSYLPDEKRLMYRYLYAVNADFFDKELKHLYDAVRSAPKRDEYFVKLIGGRFETDQAWAERGNQFAYAVTEKGWEGFQEHLEIARKLLTQAWKLQPKYPQAPALMIPISMAGADEASPRQWFDRAVAAQMDYDDAYSRLQYAMLPRWGGSIEELYDFGVECLNTGRFDTWIPWRYFQLLHTIQSESDGRWTYWSTPKTAKLLAKLFDGYEESDLWDSKGGYVFPSLRAATAWYCGRNDEAKQRVSELGDNLVSGVFHQYFGISYQSAKICMDRGVTIGEIRKNPENGHYYEIRREKHQPITWAQAKIKAEDLEWEGMDGHLATITSASEEAFVNALRPDPITCWIGGFKDSAGWKWITGEPWSYAQPDNNWDKTPPGQYVAINMTPPWIHFDQSGKAGAFVVEFE